MKIHSWFVNGMSFFSSENCSKTFFPTDWGWRSITSTWHFSFSFNSSAILQMWIINLETIDKYPRTSLGEFLKETHFSSFLSKILPSTLIVVWTYTKVMIVRWKTNGKCFFSVNITNLYCKCSKWSRPNCRSKSLITTESDSNHRYFRQSRVDWIDSIRWALLVGRFVTIF